MNKKIKKAIKKGELISYDKIFASYSKKRQKKILNEARYLKVLIALKKLRSEQKLSQQKLAAKMKVKKEYISRIESGRQNITLETFFKIAEATNTEFKFDFT